MRCAQCNQVIPAEVLKHRRKVAGYYDDHLAFCNKLCRAEYDKQHDHFRSMSQEGASQRSAALKVSNHQNPRRKRNV